MGNCCAVTRIFYTDVDNQDELEIRKFEEEKLNAYTYTFNSFKSKLSLNSNFESENKIINTFSKELGSEVINIIKTSTVFKQGELYNVTKLKALVFLLTRPELLVHQKQKYFDKASFLVQEILTNEEDKLNSPIEIQNENLKKLLEVLVEVSLNAITKYYLVANCITVNRYTEEIFKIDNQEIVDFIINNVTKVSGNKKEKEEITSFNFIEINRKFENDKWFLTPGYIREVAFNIYSLKQTEAENSQNEKKKKK